MFVDSLRGHSILVFLPCVVRGKIKNAFGLAKECVLSGMAVVKTSSTLEFTRI
jgi:hypothetical protein